MTDSPEPKGTGGQVPARYQFAEPDSGCTAAFIPKDADPRRSAAIVEHVRRWWGDEERTS